MQNKRQMRLNYRHAGAAMVPVVTARVRVGSLQQASQNAKAAHRQHRAKDKWCKSPHQLPRR
jgi:hypothetical protein